MPINNQVPSQVKGWILDAYPDAEGEVAVWIICENGKRIKLTDTFQSTIYVSAAQDELERLISRLYNNQIIVSWQFVNKYAQPTDNEKSCVLELTLKDCRKTQSLTHALLKMGDYLRYKIHNCDLRGDRDYFFSRDIFPLAFVDVKVDKNSLEYSLLDSVTSRNYTVPEFRLLELNVEIAKRGKIVNFKDPIDKIIATQGAKEVYIDSGDETDKLLQLTKTVKELDPDFLITNGGDSYLFPYLAQRATLNQLLTDFNLSRDDRPFKSKTPSGKTYFSYGRTFYRAGTIRLYGRIHIDTHSGFILSEAGFEGLIEIARTCRVPLHTAARSSIGSSMSSLQFYQAIKDDVLIPRNKSIPEAFKTAYELLVGDRGGFIYEPKVGAHDFVGEVDFSSMYPLLMANNNISAETVLCKCCPNSSRRIPELDYHICVKRDGIVPKTLRFVVNKRLFYKRMRTEAATQELRELYDKRQAALKWILVTCFGYLGYRNAKFGTVDGHIGVCAFGRQTLLRAVHTAEEYGFEVVHSIVDSLWLKKQDASVEDYNVLCTIISKQTNIPISFEGRYKWIVFLPSKTHPRIGVLNRYYGVMANNKVKVRGLEVRRRDTPRFIFDAQTDMINTLAKANNTAELYKQIPAALEIVRTFRQKLLDDEVGLWDLIITKHMSKNPKHYKQHVSQVIAAEQLIKEGAQIHAGNNIHFLFTHTEDKRHNRRVKAAQLIERDINPDKKRYLLLLYSSAANLLSFAGYNTNSIYEAIMKQNQKQLIEYQN